MLAPKKTEKSVELAPMEWDSDRPKPKERFFGDGLPGALAYLVGFVLVFSATYWMRH